MAENAVVVANDQAMDAMADEGRKGDDIMAHLTTGEIVIPLAISTNERAFEQLALMFELSGIDIRQFIVGHEKNSINPETGHPEFGWGSFVSKVTSVVTQPVKTVANVVKTGVQTGVQVAKDIGNTAVDVTKNLAKGDVGGAINSTVDGAGAVIKDTASGTVQMAKEAVKGTFKEVANIMDVVGLLPKAPPIQGPADTSPSTITQGESANQRQQSVTDVQAAAGGGASSLTPRTVAGPDNDYKLNKSAVLGL